jgi:uncharacterized protein YhhL (DUF1145 family)
MNPKIMLRNLRVLHAAFLMTMFLYVVALNIIQPIGKTPSIELIVALGALVVADLNAALFFRSRKVKPAEEKLRLRSDDAAALNEWLYLEHYLLRLRGDDCFVWICGEDPRGGREDCGTVFVVAALLLLLWTPRLDVSGVR